MLNAIIMLLNFSLYIAFEELNKMENIYWELTLRPAPFYVLSGYCFIYCPSSPVRQALLLWPSYRRWGKGHKELQFCGPRSNSYCVNSWGPDSNPSGTSDTKDILKMLSVWPRYDPWTVVTEWPSSALVPSRISGQIEQVINCRNHRAWISAPPPPQTSSIFT